MANYHLTQKVGKRSAGQSAKAKADYITREGKYTRQSDKLVYAESGNMPTWAEGFHPLYWEAADSYERSNGKLFYELEFSLPVELEEEEQIGLAQAFAQHIAEKPSDLARALPYTLAIHRGNGENPHAHLIVSERGNDGIERDPQHWFKRADPDNPERGGAKKTRALQPKRWLEEVRAEWAEMQNGWLAAHGHDARVDHRTLEDQGSTKPPQIHEGPAARAMAKRCVKSERGELNRRRIQAGKSHKELVHDFILCSAAIEAEELEMAAAGQLGELNSESEKMSDSTELKPRAEKPLDGTIGEAVKDEDERKKKRVEWKLNILSKYYGDRIKEDPVFAQYWNPKELGDGVIQLSNKAGTVTDNGDVIDVKSTGRAKGGDPYLPTAAAALHLATKGKGWKELNVNGSDDFKKTVYGLAYQADIKVNFQNEQDKKLFDQAKDEIDKRQEQKEQNSISEMRELDEERNPRGPRLG
ncbi:MAG: MobA/MobL family protein [Candidatus Thiodiazotropha sp.]|nr:MobA/MobL family protein [Candidatus Thiodiazotropha sp.]MCM8921577.1 MobA/MobL family protein [Candidatus Thiodiazotropha sp.]